MNQINVSPEMINYGLSAGQNILQNQADRLSPGSIVLCLSVTEAFSSNNIYAGFSSTWASLKYYFQVHLFSILIFLSIFNISTILLGQ